MSESNNSAQNLYNTSISHLNESCYNYAQNLYNTSNSHLNESCHIVPPHIRLLTETLKRLAKEREATTTTTKEHGAWPQNSALKCFLQLFVAIIIAASRSDRFLLGRLYVTQAEMYKSCYNISSAQNK